MQGWPPVSDDDRLKGEIYMSNEKKVSCIQKVTRRGIKADGKGYWSIELIAGFLGKRVKVEIGETSISVSEPNGNPICTFEK